MKTLFIAVSLLALTYLAFQTWPLKDWATAVAEQESNDSISKAEEGNVAKEVIATINELKAQSAQDKQALLKKIKEIEQSVERLAQNANTISERSNKTDNVAKSQTTKVASTELSPSKAELLDVRDQNENNKESNTVAPIAKAADVAESKLSQQQKRIKQQAVLRALSDKMELAALNSLAQ